MQPIPWLATGWEVKDGGQRSLHPRGRGQTGLYFNGLREARAHAQAYDAEARRRLQALTLELTGLSAAEWQPLIDRTIAPDF